MYKRQIIYFPYIVIMYFMCNEKEVHDAVSYTHLDVYKRQEQHRVCHLYDYRHCGLLHHSYGGKLDCVGWRHVLSLIHISEIVYYIKLQ